MGRDLSSSAGGDELLVDFCSPGGHPAGGACPLEFLHSQPEVQILLAELGPQEVTEHGQTIWPVRDRQMRYSACDHVMCLGIVGGVACDVTARPFFNGLFVCWIECVLH